MAIGYIVGAGGGVGVTSFDVTAQKENVLEGKTTVTSDSNDAVVNGTMPNIGKVTQTLGVNGSYTIPKGYHDGTGKVSQSLVTKGAATYYAGTSDQTIAAGQYLTGAQTIKKLTQTNLNGGNIKPGVVVKVNNGNTDVFSVTGSMASKSAATYYPGTSDQTIAANQYLTGVQTIKAVSQQNLVASNVKKGVTVYIKNGNGNLYAVTGTFEGYVPSSNSLYYYGQNIANLAYYGSARKYASFGSNDIAFTGETGSDGYVGYCLGSKSYQVSGNSFSQLTITGDISLYANVNANTIGMYVYVDLMSSSADYSRIGTYNYRIGTYRYVRTGSPAPSTVSLQSLVVPITNRTGSGYVRVWFQGFYLDGNGTERTSLGYSLGSNPKPASIKTMVFS